jgi:hypothetical protein
MLGSGLSSFSAPTRPLGFIWSLPACSAPYVGDHHELKFMVQGFEKQERQEAKARRSLYSLGREKRPALAERKGC